MPTFSRRRFLGLAAALPPFLAGCQNVPTIFGYRMGAGALYDDCIKTVHVRAFQNRAFQTTPFRGIEADITQAIVNEIGRTTNFKIESDPDKADTELIGVVVGIDKRITNRTQQNTIRDADLIVTVDVVWRDLRDGTILSTPKRGRTPGTGITAGPQIGEPNFVPFDPNIPIPPPFTEVPQLLPVRLTATGRYLPELGETNASAAKRVENQIAIQIVSMMEKAW
jgi:hypothetical protein